MLKKIAKKKKKLRRATPTQVHDILFWHFFLTCEKINQFWEFCKDQGGKRGCSTWLKKQYFQQKRGEKPNF